MGVNKQAVLRYMDSIMEEYRDPLTGEINTTALAEDAIDHFDRGEHSDVDNEKFFVWAYRLEEDRAARSSGHVAPAVRVFLNSKSSDWF